MKPYGYILLVIALVLILSQVVWSVLFGSPSYLMVILAPVLPTIKGVASALYEPTMLALKWSLPMVFVWLLLCHAYLLALHGYTWQDHRALLAKTKDVYLHDIYKSRGSGARLLAFFNTFYGGMILHFSKGAAWPFVVITFTLMVVAIGLLRLAFKKPSK